MPAAHSDSALLDRVGTTTEIAALFDVSPQAVSQWRRDGIPKPRRQTLRLLRPELFQAEADGQAVAESSARSDA
jgi:phage terminase Nu1 subunit (DNA packaging protein)